MTIPPSPLLDRETYSPWPNLYTIGLNLVASCVHVGFLDWASNQAQLRHLEAQKRRTANKRAPRPPPRPRRAPTHVRRLFIWGFISANTAISIAWAHAADLASTATAVVAGPNTTRLALCGRPIHLRSLVLAHMVDNFTLSAQSLCRGRWWTLVTHAMSHFAPADLVVNMCAFYAWASRCFDLGLGIASIAELMLGSAVCCGLASVASEGLWLPGLHMGASGVVSGLRIAATLLEPVMGFRVPDGSDVHYPVFAIVLMSGTADLIGLIFQRRELAAASLAGAGSHGLPQKMVGYAGHFGGAAFGIVYWYFRLRSRFGTW